jgi:hypothetical protein
VSECKCECATHPEGGCACDCDENCPDGLRAEVARLRSSPAPEWEGCSECGVAPPVCPGCGRKNRVRPAPAPAEHGMEEIERLLTGYAHAESAFMARRRNAKNGTDLMVAANRARTALLDAIRRALTAAASAATKGDGQ